MDSFRKEASLTAAVAALNKIQPLLSLDQRCPPPLVADETADAIHQALEGYKKRRLEVAMEAAIAAGETVVTWNIPVTPGTNRSNAIMAAQKAAAQAAKAAAEAATQKYGKGKKQKYPNRMFRTPQIELMFSSALPGYLTSFQMAMFLEDELKNIELDEEPIVAPLLRKAN